MSRLGYLPSNRAQGVGEMAAGTTRASILGSFQQATWVTSISWWAGRSGGSTANAGPAIYAASGGNLTTRLWYGGTQAVTTFMSPSDPTTGTLMTRSVTNLLLGAGQTVAGAIAVGSGGSLAYGQDNSGHPMHYSANTAPSPWSYRSSNPILAQGKMHVSLDGVTNRPPDRPVIVSPIPGGQTVDTTPEVTFRFADPDSQYGDYITDYRVEVFNATGTTRLHDSGWTATNGTEQTNGEASYSVPTLTPQLVRIVVTVRDRAGAVSPAAIAQVNVVTAGAYTVQGVGDVAGQRQDGIDVVTSTTPTLGVRWDHDDELSADTSEVRIVNHATGAVYRGPDLFTTAVPDNTSWVWSFSRPDPDWTAMATGSTVYRYEIRGTDEDGGVSPWAPSRPFVVNATPTVFLKGPADGITVGTPPSFFATISDATDNQSTMREIGFQVEHISSENTITIGAVFSHQPLVPILSQWVEAKDFVTTVIKTGFFTNNGYGDYRWRVVGEDPWGAQITDGWREFTYAEPPQITVTNPEDNGEIDTGTPTITASVDRTLELYRVRITRTDIDSVVYDSGEVENATSAISHDVPGGALPNKLDYALSIWVRAADGLENTVTTSFRLEYDPPSPLSSVSIEAVRSSDYDRARSGIPEQLPNVAMSWSAVSTGTVSDEDWLHYAIYRLSSDGNNRKWIIEDRDQTAFTDTTPAGGHDHTYYVGYERVINSGIDTIESVLTKATISVVIRHTTITSESADDPAVALHFWRDREVEPITDVELVPVFGEAAPVGFQGTLDYDIIEGEFTVLDDDSGNDWYSARDVVNAVRELKTAQPLDTVDHVINVLAGILGGTRRGPMPRTLVWRDPNGRVVPGMITRGPREMDHHRHDRATFELEFTQVARPVSSLVTVNDDDAVEVS